MPTTVLHVIPTMDRGGAEKQCALLCQGLAEQRDFDVHVALLTRGGPRRAALDHPGITVHEIEKAWKIDPLALGRLARIIKRVRPAIVQTWLFAANCYGRQAAIWAKVPVILGGERSVDPWKTAGQFAFDRYYAKRSAAIVTNSTGVVDFYARRAGLAPEKFVVIPNGVPLPPQRSSVDDPPSDNEIAPGHGTSEPSDVLAAIRAERSIPPDAHVLVAVGRLWPQKRLKDVIWAVDLVRCVREDVHLLIVGDGPERWRLERYTGQIGLLDRAHFLGERPDADRIVSESAMLLLGSGYEGQSNAILEAMAAGKPVVATDIPGNRDLVVPDQTGLLVPVGDRAAMARAILRLLDKPDDAANMGVAARARVAEHFSPDRMIGRYGELYHRLLASS